MRRRLLSLAALAAMIAVAAVASQQRRAGGLLVLEWARKAPAETPPVAVLVELGFGDRKPTDWSGRVTVAGGKVVRREAYRFRSREGDRLTEPDGWKASSHRPLINPAGQPAVSKMEGISPVGVVLHLADLKEDAKLILEPGDRALGKVEVPLADVIAGKARKVWEGRAAVRLVSTATPVAVGQTEDDYPAACYGPDGTLWVAYVSYTVRDEGRRIEQQPYKEQPESFKSLYTPEFADQVVVRSYRGGKWSEPIAVTRPKESVARCAIGTEGNGKVWVFLSAAKDQEGGRKQHEFRGWYVTGSEGRVLLAKPFKSVGLGNGGPSMAPAACTDTSGNIHAVCQSWSPAKPAYLSGLVIGASSTRGPVNLAVSDPEANCWHPAVAVGPDGKVAKAYDTCRNGQYDVEVSVDGKSQSIASTPKYEARPSIAYDAKGRLWIAYEEGPEKWGKDHGALVSGKGNPLYSARSVRVVCLDTDGKLKRPAAELPTSTVEPPSLPFDGVKVYRYERGTRYAYPQIGIDGKGRVWLTYRQNFGSRYTTYPGPYWLTFARRLDGDHWTEPIEVHHSDGLLDHRPALLPHRSGGLLILHNGDGRYTTPETVHNHVFMSYLDLPGEPVEPELVPHDPGAKGPDLEADRQRQAVKRVRAYRVEAGGKKYRLLRGELHRHTEISWDGEADGSLEDMFRYAIDVAALDWIGNTDHDNGGGREYTWWLTQKLNDAYHLPGQFTTLFAYERSVPYPNGHRNCLFARRGVRTLPRLAPPLPKQGEANLKDEKALRRYLQRLGGVHPDDTKMLYRYLKELGGICASHTSATVMGTDWRDNDPRLEPIVEIYQGDRMSYEKEGAPRSGRDPQSGEQPANVAGWYPKGFVNHALEKGYRLGFQSSSDHWSTHISYFVVLAEKNDRESLLEAIKRRHCYGATDNIVLDVRSGEYLMGDELATKDAPALQINVVGTGNLAKIDVLRDSEVVATLKAPGRQYKGAWTDPAPQPGTHYYYVRVLQQDGELAWGSPLWVTRR
jgi:hypothetical protein